MNRRNYDKYIDEVFSSRLDTTKLLVDLSKSAPIKAFINASAIGEFNKPQTQLLFCVYNNVIFTGIISF